MEPSQLANTDATRSLIPQPRPRASKPTRLVEIPSGSGNPAEPAVRLIRKGDVIEAIHLTCTCGRQTRIVCEYKAGDA